MKQNGPDPPENATTFADWVFQKTYPEAAARQAAGSARATDKERGRIAHELILESICRSSDFRSVFRRSTKPAEWDVVYPDNHQQPQTLVASNLLVDGKAVRCRPDLVLKHKATRAYMVVEYKCTKTFIGNVRRRNGSRHVFDSDGYPSNKAQLWCYSQIDEFRERDPLLILQFRDEQTREHMVTFAWRSKDRRIQEARDWFELYGGRIVTSDSRS